MDNSFLNLAHFSSRKADTHLRYRRFDEAIECHQKVANYLEEAIKSTTSLIAIDSLQLQKTYHLKQTELIKIKKAQYEKYKTVIDQQINLKNLNQTNCKNLNNQQQPKSAAGKSKTENSCQLQLDIYKTMEEADSLLEILSRKGSDTDSLKSLESDIDDIKLSTNTKEEIVSGATTSSINKKSSGTKDDSIVIEELRSLNHQLHIMVFQLVTQLDESIQEADVLRDKVRELEKEKGNFYKTTLGSKYSGGGDGASNDTVTSHRNLSPEAIEAQENYPALAPLELPNFDYESLSSKSIEESLHK